MLITTYNRGHLLARSLQKLASLTYPDELIVVNDGGQDDCSEVVADWHLTTGVNTSLYYNDNPRYTICCSARNLGLRYCSGDLILVCEPEVMFVDDIVPIFRAARESGPPAIYVTEDAWMADEGDLSGDPSFAEQVKVGEVPPFISMYDRSALERIGGWDESYPSPWGWDDNDILARLDNIGLKKFIVPGARIIHLHHERINHTPQLTFVHGMANQRHFFRKPFTHESPDHICSDDCLRARGVIL